MNTTPATGSTNETYYQYDADNRLVGTTGSVAAQFRYDYRSRRHYSSSGGTQTYHVFDGGLAVQNPSLRIFRSI